MNRSSDLGKSPIADATSDLLRHSLDDYSKEQPSIKKKECRIKHIQREEERALVS